MNRRLFAALILATSLTLTPTAAFPAPPPAASGVKTFEGKDVVYFDLFYQEQIKPRRIFFTANSGSYLKNLKWTGWGSRKAVARGLYVSECASCGPPVRRKAKIRLLGRTYCETRDVYFYQKAILTRKPSAGQSRRVRVDGAPCPDPGD